MVELVFSTCSISSIASFTTPICADRASITDALLSADRQTNTLYFMFMWSPVQRAVAPPSGWSWYHYKATIGVYAALAEVGVLGCWPRGSDGKRSQADHTPPVEVNCSWDRLDRDTEWQGDIERDRQTQNEWGQWLCISALCVHVSAYVCACGCVLPLQWRCQDDLHQLTHALQNLHAGVSDRTPQTETWDTYHNLTNTVL